MNPKTRHSYIKLNNSFVHLIQYGDGENILKSNLSESTSNGSRAMDKTNRSNKNEDNDNNNNIDASRLARSKRSSEAIKELIIFVPGNPGVLGIYHDFLCSLYQTMARPCPDPRKRASSQQPTILAMSHNNFDHPDNCDYQAEIRICVDDNDMNFVERSIANDLDPHHIELQVINKLIILKRLLNFEINQQDCKLIFIGHSIGCYVVLRLIQDKLIAAAHKGSILIHPALENLLSTRKGTMISRYFSWHIDWFIVTVASIFDKILPRSAMLTIGKWLCSPELIETSSEVVIQSFGQLAYKKTLVALINMAKSEFDYVKNLDHKSTIEPNVPKLRLIYALGDAWVNTDHRKELIDLYPDLYIEEQATMHAFVMEPKTVLDYAVKVGMFVKELVESRS